MPEQKDQPGQGQPAKPGHEVNGKRTAPGDKVHYTSQSGQQHEATVDKLDGDFADLTVHEDGAPKKYTAVPHSAVGGVHTWDHMQDK